MGSLAQDWQLRISEAHDLPGMLTPPQLFRKVYFVVTVKSWSVCIYYYSVHGAKRTYLMVALPSFQVD